MYGPFGFFGQLICIPVLTCRWSSVILLQIKLSCEHNLQVDNFDEADLAERLLAAKLTPPSIVKPQVACGVPDAHSMVMIYLSLLVLG